MNLLLIGKFFPHLIVCLNLDLLHTVQGNNIELPDGFVIFRRIACCHNDPSFRYLLVTEGLALQELEHGGCQCLRHAVDLIDKENSFLLPCLLHLLIDRGNDLTHGIFRHRAGLSLIFFFPDKRKANGTLAGMMGDGVGKKGQSALFGHLLHNLGLTDTWRSHEQHRALADHRNPVLSVRSPQVVCINGMFDFFFCSLDIHKSSSSSIRRIAQGGTLTSL